MLRRNLAPLDAYLADAAFLGPKGFVERYPWPMLVIPEPSAEVLRQLKTSDTLIRDGHKPTMTVDLMAPEMAGASLDALCLEVRPRVPNSATISAGRSPESDVILVDQTVSRRHAEFRWSPANESCTLIDVAPRNGTFVEGQRLAPGSELSLAPGMALCFGSLSCRYYTPQAFMAWLNTGAPRAGAAPGKWPEHPEQGT